MTERIEFVAKTVDEAIMNAMKHFKTTRNRINVRIVEQGSKGLFGFGAKDAKIVASLKDITEEPAPKKSTAKAEEKVEKKQPAKTEKKAPARTEKIAEKKAPARTEKIAEKKAPVKDENVEETFTEKRALAPLTEETAKYGEAAALEFVNGLIQNMKLDCTATAEVQTDCVKIVLHGEDVGTLIGRRGDTLDSVQYLTNLFVNRKRKGDDYCRIIVDSETYRAKRQETLVRLANSMASKAVKYRKDMSLEPMNPYERRIIHSALQDKANIKTKSVGEEPNRRVVVMFKK